MIVIADASPLNYLTLIGQIDLLPTLFKNILIPQTVFDPGERDAIILALEIPADLVLMDDAKGRQEAERHHVRVIGTLSVLEQAAKKGLVRFEEALAQLEQTNFRLSAKLRASFLERIKKTS